MDKTMDRSGRLVQKKFRQYLIPMILASLASSLSEFLDGIVVSNLLGSDALALINLGMPVVLAYAVVYSLIGIGGSSQYAVLLGEGDRQAARRVYSVSMYAMLGISFLFTAAGILFSGPLAGLLTNDPALSVPLTGFLKAQFLSAPVIIGATGLSYFVTNEGYPHTATVVFSVANIINILMDYVYILVFHMGVEGTAYATATGYAVGLLIELAVIYQAKRRSASGMGLKLVRTGMKELRSLPGLCMRGIGSAFNQLGFVFRYVVINALAQLLAESTGIVLFSLCMQTFSFISLFVAGVVQTMIPIVAVLSGERDRKGVRFILSQSNRYLLCFTAAALVLFEAFPGLILRVYHVTDAAVAAEAVWAIRVFSLGYVLRNIQISIMMYTQTIGEKKEPVLISFMDAVVLCFVCCVLGSIFGIRGIWIAFPVNSLLVMAAILLYSKARARRNRESSLRLYPLPEEDTGAFFDVSIGANRQEAVDASRQIASFAVQYGVPEKNAYLIGLAVEEMSVYTIRQWEANGEKGGIDIFASVRGDAVLIRFRSGGRPFSPTAFQETSDDPADHIRVLTGIADSVEYDCVLGMNTTRIQLRL